MAIMIILKISKVCLWLYKGEKSPLFFCAILPIDIVAEMW